MGVVGLWWAAIMGRGTKKVESHWSRRLKHDLALSGK